MAKKIEINENWEPVEVEDLDNLFVVIFKHGSFDQGYVEAFDTDDILMQSAYDNLANQYAETDCDELTKIYLIKVPNTTQTTELCNTGLFNGSCCDPHVIEAVKDLYNRADVEQLSCWEGCGLTEAKKKKKYPAVASSITYTTGDPDLNIKHFNKMMGTDGLGPANSHPHLVVGDVLPSSPVAGSDGTSGESSGGEAAGSEAGSMGESLTEGVDAYDSLKAFAKKYGIELRSPKYRTFRLCIDPRSDDFDKCFEEVKALGIEGAIIEQNAGGITIYLPGSYHESLTEAKEENLEEKVREIIKGFFGEDKSRMSILEYDDGWDGFVEKFDEEEIDFGKFIYNDLTDKEIEEGKPVITFLLSGGLNGSGDWINYLGDISKLFKEFEDKLNLHAIVYKVETDIPDDLWTAEVLLYIDRDTVKESLNEDLIVIDKKDAKEYLDEIKSQIEDAKDWKVRKNLLTLMNIYLFQTLYESDHQEETGCDINKEEWDKYSEWHTEQGEKLVDEHPELKEKEAEEEAKEDAESEELDEELWPKEHNETTVEYFETDEVMKAKVKDWLAAEKPTEFQIEDIPADLTWEEVINAYKEGKEPRGGLHLDTEPREYIWQRAGELYYLQTGKFLDADFERIYKEKRTDLQTPEEKVEGEEMLMATKPGVPEDEVAVEEPAEEEQPMEEQLNEAHLDYSTQLAKMKALENRTRGFNAASASDEKLEYNWKLCKKEGLSYAQSVMEQEMLRRGGRLADLVNASRKMKVKIIDYVMDAGELNLAAAKVVCAERSNPQKLIKDYDTDFRSLLIILIFALALKDATLAGLVKDHIISKFTVTLAELKEWLNKIFADKQLAVHITNVLHNCHESLEEDKGYSHKLEAKFELPPQIKLLDQKQVEDFIKQLAPEELFRVGYATPLYFYSELDDKFDLVKATEMEGYTGLDYRDATGDENIADHAARIANAQRQIDTYQDGAKGHKLNKEGERFSTNYRATNKLALNPEKSNEYIEYELDDEGKAKIDNDGQKIVKAKIDMNKILFYPRVGSVPITHYYVDFHNGQGFRPVKREVLVDTLYKFILEVEKANEQGISKTDLLWLQKKGYGNIKKDSMAAVEAFYKDHPEHYAIWVYRKAEEANIPVEDYVKEHPHSPRWSMSDFRKKATSLFDADAATIMAQDAATVSNQELAAVKGKDRNVNNWEAKPQVRALYSNQVYFLDGKPGKFGSMLKEGLEEDVELDEAKRYVKRYYVRPQNIFCSNKEDILQALLRVGDENCSIYSLKNLPDHNDVHLLKPSDIIYYYDDHVLYDKNHVQVMDYDLFVKHEEDRKKVANVDAMSDAAFADEYEDRVTDDDLKDKEVIANFKAINAGEFKEDLALKEAVEFADLEKKKDFNRQYISKFAEVLNGINIYSAKRTSPTTYSKFRFVVEKLFVGANSGNIIIKTTSGKQFVLTDFGVWGSKKPHLELEDKDLNEELLLLIDNYKYDYNEAAKTSNRYGRGEEHRKYKAKRAADAVLKSERCEELKNWLAEHITSIYFKLPTCSDIDEVVLDDTLSPEDFESIVQKWDDANSKFLALWKPALVEGQDFDYRDAAKEPETVSVWYKRRGPTCNITFDCDLAGHEVPEEVDEMIALAKRESEAVGVDRVVNYDIEGNKLDSYYTGRALGEIFNYDINFYKKPAAPVAPTTTVASNDLDQDFPNVDINGDVVESLNETKEEEKCCICGEPINGYGNNPEPYKHEGRCCDACNLKFVIPARLAALGDKEEE